MIIEIHGNLLKFKDNFKLPEKCKEVKYYLRLDGLSVSAIDYNPNEIVELELNESGIYDIHIEYILDEKIYKRTSEPLWFFLESDEREFIKCELSTNIKSLDFYNVAKPWNDFFLVRAEGKSIITGSFLDSLDFKRFKLNNDVELFTNGSINAVNNEDFFLSGITRDSEKIISKGDELNSKNINNVTQGEIGDYTLVYTKGDKVIVGTDYFGFAKIYYYNSNGIFICTNRYHLMLMVIKELNISVNFNTEKVKASFTQANTMLCQNFSEDMDVEGVKMLRADTRMLISESELIFQKTELYEDLISVDCYTDEKYKKMLEQSKNELIDNIKVATNTNTYSTIRMDLTGGLDSRLVYAAATNTANHKNKVVVHAGNYTRTGMIDVEIATKVNSIGKLPYDNLPVVFEGEDFKMSTHSYYLGSYYDYDTDSVRARLPDGVLRLVGGFGEFFRPYFSLRFYNDKQFNWSVNEICSSLTGFKGKRQVFIDQEKNLERILKTELKKLTFNRSNIHILEFHYLFYRHGLHFTGGWRAEKNNAPAWFPLQSKIAFKTSLMCFEMMQGKRFIFDLIESLNKEVSMIPYASEQYNLEKIELGMGSNDFENKNSFELAQWTKVNSGKEYIKKPSDKEFGELRVKQLDLYRNLSTYVPLLKTIGEYNKGEFKKLIMPIYCRLKKYLNENSMFEYNILVNKVWSLYFQISIINPI